MIAPDPETVEALAKALSDAMSDDWWNDVETLERFLVHPAMQALLADTARAALNDAADDIEAEYDDRASGAWLRKRARAAICASEASRG